ncbi:MAG: NAD(P)H-dependent oxidoreductase subunit E [Candidatus Brocadiia bacterium]
MLESEKQLMHMDIEHMAKKLGYDRASLMPILEFLQNKYHYIPDFAMQDIADKLKVHPVEVYSVVTFYAFLSPEAKGKFTIRLCRTISCDLAGKEAVARQLANELGISFGETTPDGRFTLEYANCLGMCDQGPAMLVNEQVFTNVTPIKVSDVIEACRRQFSASAMHKEAH